MVERVKRWIREGIEVRIFTARVSTQDDHERAQIVIAIHDWLAEQGLPFLDVTCMKDFAMVELWDDRAVQVKMNTGEPVGYSTRGNN